MQANSTYIVHHMCTLMLLLQDIKHWGWFWPFFKYQSTHFSLTFAMFSWAHSEYEQFTCMTYFTMSSFIVQLPHLLCVDRDFKSPLIIPYTLLPQIFQGFPTDPHLDGMMRWGWEICNFTFWSMKLLFFHMFILLQKELILMYTKKKI